MEKKRLREIITALLVLVALVLVVWWLLFSDKQKISTNSPSTSPEVSTQQQKTKNQSSTPTSSPSSPRTSSPETIARTFIERIGSYSSESDYRNVDDVLGLVTPALASTLLTSAEHARAVAPDADSGYYGISTSYVGAERTATSDTSVTLLVQTQREESFGSPGNTSVRYQHVEVSMIKEGDVWRIAAYTWQDV